MTNVGCISRPVAHVAVASNKRSYRVSNPGDDEASHSFFVDQMVSELPKPVLYSLQLSSGRGLVKRLRPVGPNLPTPFI